MICTKYDNRINTGTKCSQCGYDVSKKPDKNSDIRSPNKISPAEIGFMREKAEKSIKKSIYEESFF